ncbi:MULTISPECIES: helix-turn-helix domain-containing protein [Streptomyces]|uniref:LysR family transcriptional regulator n=1 Tax=Streptomyces ramulosus TaxID=47762 RepID=A0ABW1FF10_9ACTN
MEAVACFRRRGGEVEARPRESAASTHAILRDALNSSNARQRLERFAAALSCPTVIEAARAVGIHQSTPATQISRLEGDLGRPLIERAERGRRARPTPFGGKVAAAANRLTGPDWWP